MSTILLPLIPLFDATNPPGFVIEGTRQKLVFDASTPEIVYWQFRLPPDYSGSPILKIQYAMKSAATGSVAFEASIMAVTPGDVADIDADSFATANVAHDTVASAAGYLKELAITLTNTDSMAAGDLIVLKFRRVADDATNDTATGDAEVHAVALQYS